jgi:glycosyltransferase involved in cell wall biosynthesis
VLLLLGVVVIYPSIDPGSFGRVPVESEMFACPVVAYRSGGLPETLVVGTTGPLLEVGDTPDVRKCILRLLDKSRLADDHGANARRPVARLFSVESVASRINDCWRDLC